MSAARDKRRRESHPSTRPRYTRPCDCEAAACSHEAAACDGRAEFRRMLFGHAAYLCSECGTLADMSGDVDSCRPILPHEARS